MTHFARAGKIAGAGALAVLAVVLEVAPAGAAASATSVNYTCVSTVLGSSHTFTSPVKITSTAPKTVPPDTTVKLTGVQFSVTIPASVIAQAEKSGIVSVSGRVETLTINATDAKPGAVNAAGKGIAIPKTNLPKPAANVTIALPSAPTTVSGWVASKPGTMVFTVGTLSGILTTNAGKSGTLTCKPTPTAVLNKTTVS